MRGADRSRVASLRLFARKIGVAAFTDLFLLPAFVLIFAFVHKELVITYSSPFQYNFFAILLFELFVVFHTHLLCLLVVIFR